MKSARSLFLAAVATALLVTACSQPNDLQTPGLEAQFGGRGDDAATAVSVASNGTITKGVQIASSDNKTFTLYLRQLAPSATSIRQINLGQFPRFSNPNASNRIESIKTDGSGNIYALTAQFNSGPNAGSYQSKLYKFGTTGQNPLWTKESDNLTFISQDFDLDSQGNVFVAQTKQSANGNAGLSYFTRYNKNGVKWYQRNSQVGSIDDLEVTSSGDVYIIGSKGLSRYNNNGSLIWTKPIFGTQLESSGSSIFVLEIEDQDYAIKVSKRTNAGAVIWATQVAGDGFSYAFSLAADTKGNTYYTTEAPDVAPSAVNKLGANGEKAWSKVLSFNGDTAGAQDIASYDGSSVYAVGSTSQSVNGADYGGRDAFIVRLNAQGQKVWER